MLQLTDESRAGNNVCDMTHFSISRNIVLHTILVQAILNIKKFVLTFSVTKTMGKTRKNDIVYKNELLRSHKGKKGVYSSEK